MKRELIHNVISQMMPYLDNDQAARLQEVVEHSLFHVTASQEETRAEDKVAPLEAFISAKKVEGCSDKTLAYYRKTVQDMLDAIGKPAQQILAYPVVQPSANQLVEFNTISEPTLAKIENGNQENKRLISMRDTLLPKLISGVIDVSSIAL